MHPSACFLLSFVAAMKLVNCITMYKEIVFQRGNSAHPLKLLLSYPPESLVEAHTVSVPTPSHKPICLCLGTRVGHQNWTAYSRSDQTRVLHRVIGLSLRPCFWTVFRCITGFCSPSILLLYALPQELQVGTDVGYKVVEYRQIKNYESKILIWAYVILQVTKNRPTLYFISVVLQN